MNAPPPVFSYDAVAYPSAIFFQTHPDRLAAIARIHGLSPPPVETARVLDIAGGDGMNMLALAAAYPGMTCTSFDLATSAVTRGEAMRADAGLDNVELLTLDIMAATERFAPRSFDYVIAHGLYAWVPEPVREATLALIDHVLAPDGVAFVSYNALPGGHVRQIMRDMLLHALEGVEGSAERVAAARAFLEEYAAPRDDDGVVAVAMRRQAEAMLGKPGEVLFHDELGDCFAPQSLTQVTAAAARHGLVFLNDSGQHRLGDGMLPEGMDGGAETVIRLAQSGDYAELTFFRQTLFVRDSQQPRRRPDGSAIRRLWASAQLLRTADDRFESGESSFGVEDVALVAFLERVAEHWPGRVRVGDYLDDDERALALFYLFDNDLLRLHTGPEPFWCAPGTTPCVSPLIRAQLRRGDARVCTLDHRSLELTDDATRRLIERMDGSRSVAELGEDAGALDRDALDRLARHAVFTA